MEKIKIEIFVPICLILMNIFLAGAVSIDGVVTSPQEVAPGGIVDITLKIENPSDEDLFNLEIKLNLKDAPFAPYQSSSERFIDKIEQGEEENFHFKLIALPSTPSGIYKIPVEINYEDNNSSNYSKEGVISITINSEPELTLSLEKSAALIRGKENEISIKLINSGLADVKFVYMEVKDSKGIKFLSEKTKYIGDVDSDDFDSADYTVYIDEKARKTVKIPVVLRYRDSTNKEFTETMEIPLRTYSLKEATELGIIKKPNYLIYTTIPLLIFGYISYRIIKKKRLKNKFR